MSSTVWSAKVRQLHWAMVVTITFQQFSALFMSDPGTQFLFPYHRLVGVAAALVVLLFWLYSYAVYDLSLLFPWGREGRRLAWAELRGILQRRLPPAGHRVGLSSFVHGLGILAASGAALTGLVIFAMVPPGHVGPPEDPLAFTRYVLMHKFFGEALWVYWFGHIAFALAHQLAGDRVFGAIFGRRDLPGNEE